MLQKWLSENRTAVDILFLSVIGTFLFFILLGHFPIEVPDAARYAEIPREMLARMDFVTPYLNGVKYFEKPPLFYWMQVLSFKTFGINDFSAHFMNALCALATSIATYCAGKKLFSRQAGIVASLILMTCSLFFGMARIVTLDMGFTLFFTLSMYFFMFGEIAVNPNHKRNYFWAMYLMAACATLTKGLIGFVLPGMVIFIWILLTNNWHKLKEYRLVTGTLIFLAITAPWHILVSIRNPGFFHFYFIDQHFARYFTDYAGREKPLYYLPLLFIAGILPWTFFLPQTLYHHLPTKFAELRNQPKILFLILWIAIILIFFSVSQSQLPPYILPIFAPTALLIADYLSTSWKTQKQHNLNATITFSLIALFTFALAIVLIVHTQHLDFSQQILKPYNYYLVTGIAILIGISLLVSYQKFGSKKAFYTLAFGWMLFLISMTPLLSLSNNKTAKPLADFLKPRLNKNIQVAIYDAYMQDVPYYLRRRVMVINYYGELYYGMMHAKPKTRAYYERDPQFFKKWNSNQKIVAFVEKKNLASFEHYAKLGKLNILAVYLNMLLIANYQLGAK